MAKDLESLEQSRQVRQYLLSNWGRLPSSIWKVDWTVKVNDLSTSYNDFQKEQAGKVGKEFSLSSAGHGKEGGLSRFPQDICQFLIKFYSKELDTVFDPFTGHNSRMESCYRVNRHYIGFDICHQFMEWNRQVKSKIEEENSKSMTPLQASITLHEHDSRDILRYVDRNIADFCITSPPFYDVEYYSDDAGQFGNAKTYKDFMYSLGDVVASCYEVLKPGAFIAWEVNDFRRNGTFHVYHSDLVEKYKAVGFLLHDVIIVDYGSSFLASFLSDVEHNKIMPKQHSYIIVGRKPTHKTQPTRNKTYDKLKEEAKQQVPIDDSKAKQIKMI